MSDDKKRFMNLSETQTKIIGFLIFILACFLLGKSWLSPEIPEELLAKKNEERTKEKTQQDVQKDANGRIVLSSLQDMESDNGAPPPALNNPQGKNGIVGNNDVLQQNNQQTQEQIDQNVNNNLKEGTIQHVVVDQEEDANENEEEKRLREEEIKQREAQNRILAAQQEDKKKAEEKRKKEAKKLAEKKKEERAKERQLEKERQREKERKLAQERKEKAEKEQARKLAKQREEERKKAEAKKKIPPPPKLELSSANSKNSAEKSKTHPLWLQVGVFEQRANANKLALRLKKQGFSVDYYTRPTQVKLYVGPYSSQEQVNAAKRKLSSLGVDARQVKR